MISTFLFTLERRFKKEFVFQCQTLDDILNSDDIGIVMSYILQYLIFFHVVISVFQGHLHVRHK
jgi:hypothetical protein